MIIARAHGNWLARLGLTVVCENLGFRLVVLPKDVCWSCCIVRLDHLQFGQKKEDPSSVTLPEDRSIRTEKVSRKIGIGDWKIALIQ